MKKRAKKAAKKPADDWGRLAHLIEIYRDAAIADAEKGGGDPSDVPAIEAELQVANIRLNCHIEAMSRSYVKNVAHYHPGDDA